MATASFGSRIQKKAIKAEYFIIAVQGAGRIFTMDSDFHIGEADVIVYGGGRRTRASAWFFIFYCTG
jgi:uncharacterized protein with PhoU and TrkA domain